MAHAGEDQSAGWTLTPGVTIPLALLAILYAIGFLRLRRRSAAARALHVQRGGMFVAGWLTLAGSLVSPLHEAGEASFTMHMIEHELIMLPAALLIVAARPGPVLIWAFPEAMRGALASVARLSLWRWLTGAVVATVIQAAVLIVWHAPALFDLALASEGWHVAQHLSFLLSALAFWAAMLGNGRRLVAAVCLFATSVVGGLLGALMSISASPWYAPYARMGMTPFGLSPVEDQQLAGLIMWVPGGLFHLAAALVFIAGALQRRPSAKQLEGTRT
jgi:cytochrome c oxidase assembly factor CtaG